MGNIFVVQSYAEVGSFSAYRLPCSGETLIADEYFAAQGGKGLNQAEAARFFGANVEVIGRVGNDDLGRENKKICEEYDIGHRFLVLDEAHATGKCAVFRSATGENCIMVYPGAAAYFSVNDFKIAEAYIKTCKIGGFQFEVNAEAVYESICCADEWGVDTFLDPAPVPERIDEGIYKHLNFIKPNEHEAQLLTGISVEGYDSARKAGEWFLNKGVKTAAIVTIGKQGSVLVTHNETRYYSAPQVTVKDSSAAGDCFAGAFIASIAAGGSLDEAMVRASCMAALKVTSKVKSICEFDKEPYRTQYARLLHEYSRQTTVIQY